MAQAIDGTANEITAAITQVTGQQPSSVASSPVIASIANRWGRDAMTRTTEAGRAPRWVQVTSLALSLAAVAVACVSHGDALQRPGRPGLPGHGRRQLHAGHDELVVGDPRRPRGRPRAGVVVGHGGPDLALGLANGVGGIGRARMAAAALGAATVLYLVYVELFRIGAICLWCTAVHVLAVCLFGGGPGAGADRAPGRAGAA